MFGEEILIEIDGTLDQLIRNAEVIQEIDLKDLTDTEISAFQKTQESLLQHLLHLDEYLEIKRKSLKVQNKKSAGFKIQQKLLQFEKMKSSYQKDFKETKMKTPILSKRRSKRFLSIR